MFKQVSTKQKIIYLSSIIIFILICCIIFVNFMNDSSEKNDINFKSNNIKLQHAGNNPEIYSCGKEFFFITKDGVKVYNSSGVLKWEEVFNMSETPMVASNEDYVAIAEKQDKNLYVANSDKLLYNKKFDNIILNVSINNQGYASVILQNGDNYTIYTYDDEGVERTKTEIQEENLIPIATSISNDNSILAISLLNISPTELNLKSTIVLYSIDKKNNEEFNDNVIGSILDKEELIGKIKFMDNNMLIGISDKEIFGIEINKTKGIQEKWNSKFKNILTHSLYLNNNIIATVFSNDQDKNNDKKSFIVFYDIDGNITGKYYSNNSINYINGKGDNVVLKTGVLDRHILALDTNGKKLWQYNLIQDIKSINFIENTNKILVSGILETDILERSKKIYNNEQDLEDNVKEKSIIKEGLMKLKENNENNNKENTTNENNKLKDTKENKNKEVNNKEGIEK